MTELDSPTRSARAESIGSGRRERRAYLVLSLECQRPLAGSLRIALDAVDSVTVGRGAGRSTARQPDDHGEHLMLTVPDEWMSSTHARLRCSFGRWLIEDAGSKNGIRVNGRRVQSHVLEDRDVAELGRTFFVYRDRTTPDLQGDDNDDGDGSDDRDDKPGNREAVDVAEPPPAPGLSTFDIELAGDVGNLVRVAQTGIAVLLLGESGTGKELLARAVHELSGRPGEFVPVNCGALPENLVESELFGHRAGAFSGATTERPGLVRAAHRGTLFLDEIGDLRPPSQAALLRVLQTGEVRPVGDVKTVKVDIRMVCATHRDLARAVERGEFRHDLYARIAGFRMNLPTVHERIEDRGLLVTNLLTELAAAGDAVAAPAATFDPRAARALFFYHWPLNVRELSNCLRTATVLAGDGVIRPMHLPPEVRTAAVPSETTSDAGADPLTDEQSQLRDQLVALLAEHRGNISHVARAAGKARRQIQRWIKRFDLDPEQFRS